MSHPFCGVLHVVPVPPCCIYFASFVLGEVEGAMKEQEE